jgi:hypothetical protein
MMFFFEIFFSGVAFYTMIDMIAIVMRKVTAEKNIVWVEHHEEVVVIVNVGANVTAVNAGSTVLHGQHNSLFEFFHQL